MIESLFPDIIRRFAPDEDGYITIIHGCSNSLIKPDYKSASQKESDTFYSSPFEVVLTDLKVNAFVRGKMS